MRIVESIGEVVDSTRSWRIRRMVGSGDLGWWDIGDCRVPWQGVKDRSWPLLCGVLWEEVPEAGSFSSDEC